MPDNDQTYSPYPQGLVNVLLSGGSGYSSQLVNPFPPPPQYQGALWENPLTGSIEALPENPTYPHKTFGELRELVKEITATLSQDAIERLVRYMGQRYQAKAEDGVYNFNPGSFHLRIGKRRVQGFLLRLTGENYSPCEFHRYELLHPDSTIRIGDKIMCEAARDEYYSLCDGCTDFRAAEELNSINGGDRYLCSDCYTNEGYNYCNTCGCHVNNNEDCDEEECEAREHGMERLLYGHSTDVLREIKGFLFTPGEEKQVTANGMPGSNLFFGIELEVLPRKGIAPHEALKTSKAALKDYAIAKSDGSLNAGGFELVTVPATLEFHRRELWNKFFGDNGQTTIAAPHNKEAPANKLKAWNTDCCGLHIHFSRAALSPMQLGKMLVFMHAEENERFLTRLAGRPITAYAEWCRTRTKRLRGQIVRDPQTMLPIQSANMTYQGEAYDHYEVFAVSRNTNNRTCEMRMFRGNASRHGVMRALDFTASLIQFCGETGAQELNYKAFLRWFNLPQHRGAYPDLWRQLISLSYIRTAHEFKVVTEDGKLRTSRLCSELPDDQTGAAAMETSEPDRDMLGDEIGGDEIGDDDFTDLPSEVWAVEEELEEEAI